MAIREIVWTVSENGQTIHPTAPQDGGVQGEHNATRAVWRVGENSVWETPTFKVYVECEDNAGNVDHTEPLQVEGGQISVLLPQAWTQYGGISTLSLVAEEEDGVVAYSVEGYARFSSRQNASKKVDGLMKGRLAQMEARMQGAVDDATSAAEDAASAAETAVVAKNSAEYAAQSASVSREGAQHFAEQAAEALEGAQHFAEQAAEALEGVPIKYIESPDADGNIVCFRNLPSGTYSLKGTFMPCFETEDIVELSEHPFFANIMRGKQADTGVNESHIQIYNPGSNALRYYICTNFAYTSQTIYFNELTSRQAVEDMISAAGGGIIVDDAFNGESTNPVQNAVIAQRFMQLETGVKSAYDMAEDALAQIGDTDTGLGTISGVAYRAYERAEEAHESCDTIGQMANYAKMSLDYTVKPHLTAVETAIANQRIVNARDYGAVGDGVTDDTEAIQAALHFAEDNELPLYIPAGNYLVSKTISTYTRDTDADKQSKVLNIYGAGMNTTFTTTEDFEGDYVFYIDVARTQPRMLWVHDFAIDLVADVSGIYFNEVGMASLVENLWITHKYDKDPTDTNVRAGIYCRMATVTTFQRVKVMGNLKRIGSGLENIGIVCESTYSTKFIDCDIIFCKWGIYLSGGSNNLIEHCRIDENEYGVYQNTTAPSIDYMPETRAYPADGEKFQGTARNLTIRGNRFEANNQQAIFLAAYSFGEMNYMYNAQVTIANNDFSSLGTGTAMHTSARTVFRKAIWLYQCKGVVIENNCFSGMPYDETVADTRLQNLVGERIEDITLRGNVAITRPIWYDDGSYTIEKTNPVLSVEFVNATDFIPDIEADQCTRYSLGDLSLALDAILAIQEGLLGPTLITFYAPTGEYQAEDGMTWGEWLVSKYNIDGFILSNSYVTDSTGGFIYDAADGGQPETADTVIIAGHTYVYD